MKQRLYLFLFQFEIIINQGIDGSERKPAHIHDTDFMVKESYHLAPHDWSLNPIF